MPPIHRELHAMDESLRNHPNFNSIYRGMARADANDEGAALIFIHERMLAPLRQCTQLLMDGTFRVSRYLNYSKL